MPRTQIVAVALLAIVALAAGMWLARTLAPDSTTAQLPLAKATVLEPPRPLPQFALVDHEGEPFGPEQLRGQWSFVFFGFTSCPDICPATLGVLAQTEKMLADLPAPERPQVVLVSVDPKRDTPAHLESYVHFFSPAFAGLTGTQQQIDDFTRAMGVPVVISPIDEENYNVDHSAAIFLIDPQGELRALFSTPHSADVIVEDYRQIVAASGGTR